MATNIPFAELAKLLDDHFSRTEIQTLCFDLGIDYEDISGSESSKSLLVRQMIAYLLRRNRLEELIYLIEQTRPFVSLPNIDIVSLSDDGPQLSADYLEQNLQVFLCHAKEDKPAVREIYLRLKNDGYQPWFDEESLVAGQDWKIEIAQALRSSDVVLVCSSRESVAKSGFVQNELRQAIELAQQQPEGAIFLIPLRLDDCQLPEFLSRYHWIDYPLEDGYRQLTRALRAKAASLGIRPTTKFHYQSVTGEDERPGYSKFDTSRARSVDKKTLLKIQELLPSSSMMDWLRDFDFGNRFQTERMEPFFDFVDQCEFPEFGFLDDELERLRIDLAEAMGLFCRALGEHTFPEPKLEGLSGIPKEWHHTQRERWSAAKEELNSTATKAYNAYEKLIKAARKKLIV